MAFLFGCENVTLEYPSRKVLDQVTLGIDEGARIGIVGRNGDGKSSLLALLAGRKEPDAGRITHRGDPRIGLLTQADELDDDQTVLHTVLGDTPEYQWAGDARTRDIIIGLLHDVPRDSVIGALSGGQRRKVDLARVLIGDHDLLLLDEPTNHLDIATISWLANHLKSRWRAREGALLIVTHDRWFLDEVCTSMWEVHDGKVEPFEGGYSAYVLQRVEREEAAMRAERKRRNMMRRELAWLSRGARARATKPKFHVATAQALIADEPPLRVPLELKRSAVSRMGKKVVDLEDVTVRLGDRLVLDDLTWRIGPGDRFGIIGANGAGKTTLLKTVHGSLTPDSGRVRIGQTVRFATLSQRLEELEVHRDERVREVLSHYKTTYEIDGKEVGPSKLLEHLGFEKAHLSSYVRDLSGGQKRRLQLMLTLIDKPNVLLLDEPGNDLDTDMLVVLENLLDTWPGTLLLVTHDRYLMERVCDDVFVLEEGVIRHVPGGVDQYLAHLREQKAEASGEMEQGWFGPAGTGGTGNRPPYQPSQLSQAELRAIRKQIASTERKISTQYGKLKEARAEMGSVDPTDYLALSACEKKADEIQACIDELEALWLELSEKI